MHTRRLAAPVAALVALGVAAPVAGASAAGTAAASAPSSTAPPALTFVPPSVAPIRVMIGATFYRGKLISPGVNVSTPGTSLRPITWSPGS
jgi:hypothetical protein